MAELLPKVLTLKTCSNDINTIHADNSNVGITIWSILSSTINAPNNTGGLLISFSRFHSGNNLKVSFEIYIPATKGLSIVHRVIYQEGSNPKFIGEWIEL